jgi:hypothetical protein
MLKLAVVAMAALCLAVPTVAAAEDHAHAVDHITCGDGTVLTPPFSSPVCAEHGAVASVTCASGATLTPPLDGKRCPAAPEGDGPSAPPEQPAGDAPSGDAQASALDAADTVVVMAKLLPQAKWQQDEDGTPVPTLRARKIVIRS